MIEAVVLARLALPLLIPRIPLMILAALVLDGIDHSLLAHFSSIDLGPFELFDSRAMLLVFPNTFEFFFTAYEGLRTRWDPERWSGRFWLYVAGGIWVFIKLPQEYWIHVAKLDFTETVANHPWFGALCAVGLGALAWVVWFVVRPRMPEPLPGWRFTAPPLPATPQRRAPGVRWSELAEKSVLLTLLAVIVAEILPSVHLSALDIVLGVVALVAANMAITDRAGAACISRCCWQSTSS